MRFLGLGTPELILIVIVLLLFFGKDKLPELAKSIGKSVKELRSGLDGSKDEKTDEIKTERKDEAKAK